MKPVVVLYATREGQSRRIAEHLAQALRDRGRAVQLEGVANLRGELRFEDFDAALLVASVHLGRHEKEMIQLVKRERGVLETMPTAFVSVSLSEAGAEDRTATPEMREKAKGDVTRMIDDFIADTGWHPDLVKPVAGAFAFSRYGFFVRLAMKRMAKKVGADPTKDTSYTDWAALDEFAGEFLANAS